VLWPGVAQAHKQFDHGGDYPWHKKETAHTRWTVVWHDSGCVATAGSLQQEELLLLGLALALGRFGWSSFSRHFDDDFRWHYGDQRGVVLAAARHRGHAAWELDVLQVHGRALLQAA